MKQSYSVIKQQLLVWCLRGYRCQISAGGRNLKYLEGFFFKLTFRDGIVYFLRTVTLEIERKITKYIFLKIISSKKNMQKASKRQKAKERATGNRNKNPQ